MKQPLEKYWPEMTRVVDRRIRKEERPIPTPWDHLNKLLGGGFWPGLHPIISGPGNGKTTFAVQIAAHAASMGFETYYASLELDETQIVLRMASALHGTLSWKDLYMGEEAQRGTLDDMFWKQVKGLPLVLDTGNPEGWRIEEIEAWAKESDHKQTRLCVVDYLQLANSGEGEEAISKVSYLAKRLQDQARLNNMAIVAVSSTARSNYDDQQLFEDSQLQGVAQGNTGIVGNHAPVMRMAKESGEIEYGATSLSALVRRANRAFLVIAKRRLDEGGVWCSFKFENAGFQVDPFRPPAKAPPRPPRSSERVSVEDAFARALVRTGVSREVFRNERS